MQLELTGFLHTNASKFMSELWTLLLSAQADPKGIPPQLLQAKKEQLLREREAAAGDGLRPRRRGAGGGGVLRGRALARPQVGGDGVHGRGGAGGPGRGGRRKGG